MTTMLSSFFYPVLSDKKRNYFSVLQNRLSVSDLLNEQLVTNPLYKLLNLKNLPQMPDSHKNFSANLWSALEKRVIQMSISNTTEGNTNWTVKPGSQGAYKAISNLLIVRGESMGLTDAMERDYKFPLIANKDIYSNKISTSHMILKDNHRFNNNTKSLCLMSNSQAYLKDLETLTKNTYKMIHAKAYAYQYEKYGLTLDDFEEALARVEQIHHNYSQL